MRIVPETVGFVKLHTRLIMISKHDAQATRRQGQGQCKQQEERHRLACAGSQNNNDGQRCPITPGLMGLGADIINGYSKRNSFSVLSVVLVR